MKTSSASQGQPASELISRRIAELGDWRGKTLGRMRKLIKEADPEVVEEWKWMGTPVWSHHGIICTGESYKNVVKLTFPKGASLARIIHESSTAERDRRVSTALRSVRLLDVVYGYAFVAEPSRALYPRASRAPRDELS